jgi:hypothetical protein
MWGIHLKLEVYTFQGDVDIPLLKEVQASVEELFVNGQPRHHLDSARAVSPDYSDSTLSAIFVVEYREFVAMDPMVIQTIFRRRHILVLDVPTEEMAFDEYGLSTLGSLTKSRQIQGKFLEVLLR